jgi:SSS family solute:Na+ symporter
MTCFPLSLVTLSGFDWSILLGFFVVLFLIGLVAAHTAGRNTSQFFLGGRNMPWWLLGISMVACTFAADTPMLVTDLVRQHGVSGNWVWWAFLITGMVTVFLYARLWRRSEAVTDLEFYELRYDGRKAAFLRGFRAIFLGLFFNGLIMATVNLALIKYGQLLFGIPAWQCLAWGSVGVLLYATLGGLKGVLWADFFQFSIAMTGALVVAISAVSQPEIEAIGGLSGLLGADSPIRDRLNFLPDWSDPSLLLSLLIIPVAVQWWAVWYPGAEPGGGGYIAQRMLSARNENHALGATLFFNFMHYAIRPWPWIVVALASLVVFPELDDIRQQFPHVDPRYVAHDVAYAAMLSKLGPGLLGLVAASVTAAYMSTIGTHLNWGASYLVHDFYRRFVKPSASEKHLVVVARLVTLLLALFAAILSTQLKSASQAFDLLLLSGAGTGGIYLLRWFWWRINALTEIVAMAAATLIGVVLVFLVDVQTLAISLGPLRLEGSTSRLLLAISLNSMVWLTTTLLTRPESMPTLHRFLLKARPAGPGWKPVKRWAADKGLLREGKSDSLANGVLCIFIGTTMIYSCLFAIGHFVFGHFLTGIGLAILAGLCCLAIFRLAHPRGNGSEA